MLHTKFNEMFVTVCHIIDFIVILEPPGQKMRFAILNFYDLLSIHIRRASSN